MQSTLARLLATWLHQLSLAVLDAKVDQSLYQTANHRTSALKLFTVANLR